MIAIIGAGISGLAAARELQRLKVDFQVFEATNKVGGRVKTDYEGGFQFDHGFQILLPAYPLLKKFIDLDELHLRGFSAGARIVEKHGHTSIGDPLRNPTKAISTLMSNIGNFKDKLLILKLVLESQKYSYDKVTSDTSTKEYFKNFGFSEDFRAKFLHPFFEGIFLEKQLKSPSSYMLFLFKMFSKCLASLPQKGIGHVSDLMAMPVQEHIQFHKKVERIEGTTLHFEDGQSQNFDKIILATEGPEAMRLLGRSESVPSRKETSFYFRYPKEQKFSKEIHLNGMGSGLVSNVAFLSEVQPSYAKKDELVIVNVVGQLTDDVDSVKSELKGWFADKVEEWTYLKHYHIRHAQPDTYPYELSTENVQVIGDFTQTPSLQGCLYSGIQAVNQL